MGQALRHRLKTMSEYTTKECREVVELLSPQLKEVLRRKAGGLPNKQIADELALSENTVRIYLERIYSRLRVNNIASATRVAIGAKLI